MIYSRIDRAAESTAGLLAILLAILLMFLIFYDFGRTNYLKIYRTDRRQIFKVVWLSMTNLKLVFRSPKGRFHGNQFLLFSIAGGQWRSRVG